MFMVPTIASHRLKFPTRPACRSSPPTRLRHWFCLRQIPTFPKKTEMAHLASRIFLSKSPLTTASHDKKSFRMDFPSVSSFPTSTLDLAADVTLDNWFSTRRYPSTLTFPAWWQCIPVYTVLNVSPITLDNFYSQRLLLPTLPYLLARYFWTQSTLNFRPARPYFDTDRNVHFYSTGPTIFGLQNFSMVHLMFGHIILSLTFRTCLLF